MVPPRFVMVLRAGISAARAAFEPAINGSRDLRFLCRLPSGARLATHFEAKAAMLNRATPPEHGHEFYHSTQKLSAV